jgi:hypothetical protein
MLLHVTRLCPIKYMLAISHPITTICVILGNNCTTTRMATAHIIVAGDRSKPPGTDPTLPSAAERMTRQLKTSIITPTIYPLLALPRLSHTCDFR